ncbi:MAG: hypothetical protein AAGK97_17695 [Bacteroidota bacterium]
MKLHLCFILLLCFNQYLNAQNRVGINTNQPDHTLDVNGDINLEGQFLANGNAGNAGDILTATGNGTMQWVRPNPREYDFVQTFTQSDVWLFSSNITKVRYEMWGAGGAGNSTGGGGSGAYITGTFSGSSGDMLTLNVGSGGTSSSPNGGSSSIQDPIGDVIVARGGNGSNSFGPGQGGNIDQITLFFLGWAQPGQSGAPTEEVYNQLTSTVYQRLLKYGDGGCAPFLLEFGKGGRRSIINSGGTTTYRGTSPSIASGGGGDSSIKNGGDGMIILYYNLN